MYSVIFIILFSFAAQLSEQNLTEAKSFAFPLGYERQQISAELEKLKRYDLLVLDGEEARKAQVAALRTSDTIVLAYLSVGTIEKGRRWYRKLKPFRLELWENWGEWYADIKKPQYRKRILRIARSIKRKGFDGLFLDNVDMISSYRAQSRAMRLLVKRLSKLSRRGGGYLFTQNGEDIIAPMLKYIDGWNREDVYSTYNFKKEQYELVSSEARTAALKALSDIKSKGVFTTSTDYFAEFSGVNPAQAIENACLAGAIPALGNIELTQVPEEPAECSL